MIFLLAILYAAIGAGGGWALNAYLGLSAFEAGVAGGGAFLFLLVLHLFFTRTATASAAVDDRFSEIERRQTDVSERMDVIEARTAAVETTVKNELTERRDALVSEMKELEGLIARLTKNFEQQRAADANPGSADTSARIATKSTTKDDAALREVRDALRDGRVDLHLQPVVSLPQRRTSFYEGFTRLRRENGALILPADFLDAARRASLSGVIDNIALYRCIQIVRRLSERDRRVGVFCNLSAALLSDNHVFDRFRDFMAGARDLSGAVIFEVSADLFENRTRQMRDNMDALSALGFRFSLDGAPGIGLDLPRLQNAGVRFVKVDGAVLLEQLREPGGPRPVSNAQRHVPAEDVAAVFARHGVTLIADKIEDEAMVVEVLEFAIPFGQGNVFGAPRPIKASLMQETAPPPQFVESLVGPA